MVVENDQEPVVVIIIWLKRSILLGSLSRLNFAIRTAKMDRSRTDFTDLFS